MPPPSRPVASLEASFPLRVRFLSDGHRDRRGELRSVRALRGIDSRVTVNRRLWSLAEELADGKPLALPESVAVIA